MPRVLLQNLTSFSKGLLSLFSLAVCLGGIQAVQAQYHNGTLRGTSVDDWQGWTIMKGGKGYAPSPMGQVHYRDIGPRDYKYPIVLLHRSSLSMIQWARVQNELADLGVRVITTDTPGYGTSDLPSKQPSIADFADNLIYVLDHLKLQKIVIAGYHTGSQIATSFAAHHPDRTAAVVLHGAAQLTKEEAARLLALDRTPRTPLADGSHLTRTFRPQTPPPRQAMLDAKTFGTLSTYIHGPDIGHWATYHYDMVPDLMSIQTPGMILSDTGDGIHYIVQRAAGLRPDFKYVEFSNGNSTLELKDEPTSSSDIPQIQIGDSTLVLRGDPTLELMAEPRRWAAIVADFLATINNGEKRTGLGQ